MRVNVYRIVFGLVAALGVTRNIQAQTQFNKIIVFGDSLSDGGAYTNIVRSLNVAGGSQVARFKFTTNPGNVWVENIAQRFGLPLTPNAFDGGTNFAEGGARVTLPNPSVPGFSQTPVSVQIDRYLASGGKFDKHSIVTVLAGANDAFQGGPAAVTPAAQALVQQLARLQQAGASNIVLMTLPDIGSTPSFGFGAGGAANTGTQLSVAFNTELRRGLEQLGGNIIVVDTFTLFRDVVADSRAYGIETLRGTACMTPSTSLCTPATTVPGGAETYLFADGLHPTTAGHRIFSDVAIAQLLAPSQISLLPLSVQSSLRGQQLAFDRQLYPIAGHEVRTVALYGSADYSAYKIDSSGQLNGIDTGNKAVTAGVDFQLSNSSGIGGVLSSTDAQTDFGNNGGSFTTGLTTVGVYGRHSYGPLYTYVTGMYGSFDLDDIRRNIAINTATRVESGNSSGSAMTLKLGAGYDFRLGRWLAGPLLSLNYERIGVDAYDENGASSTRLSYAAQRLSQLTGSAGLQARLAVDSPWSPYLRLSYDNDLSHDERTVTITSQAGAYPFHGMAYLPARASLSLTGGVTGKIANNLAVTVNATGILNQSCVSSWGATAGLKVLF
jgi:outer membrane lipase/esterase